MFLDVVTFVVMAVVLGGEVLMTAWGILSWLTVAAWLAVMAWLAWDIWGTRFASFCQDVWQDFVDVLEEGAPPEEPFPGDFPPTLPDSEVRKSFRLVRGGR